MQLHFDIPCSARDVPEILYLDSYLDEIFCYVGLGQEQGCYQQTVPRQWGLYQGSKKWSVISPPISVSEGGGGGSKNKWMVRINQIKYFLVRKKQEKM